MLDRPAGGLRQAFHEPVELYAVLLRPRGQLAGVPAHRYLRLGQVELGVRSGHPPGAGRYYADGRPLGPAEAGYVHRDPEQVDRIDEGHRRVQRPATGPDVELDRGVAGERYLLVGQQQERFSTAGGINRACEIAEIDHRVEDLDYRTDPEALTAEFGPTLMAIAEAAAKSERKPRTKDNLTTRRLGYEPMSFDDGLRLLISWLRELGKL